MDNFIDTMMMINLIDTMEEALNHIKKQLLELRLEESFLLIEDFYEGFYSIENALMNLENNVINKIDRMIVFEMTSQINFLINKYKQNQISTNIREVNKLKFIF